MSDKEGRKWVSFCFVCFQVVLAWLSKVLCKCSGNVLIGYLNKATGLNYFFYRILHQIPHNFCKKHFLFRRMERWENIHRKWQKFLTLECLFTFCVHAAYICIESSQDCLAHTLARLPDTRKPTSDFISPILARYDLKKKRKKTFFAWRLNRHTGAKGVGFGWRMNRDTGAKRLIANIIINPYALLFSINLSFPTNILSWLWLRISGFSTPKTIVDIFVHIKKKK